MQLILLTLLPLLLANLLPLPNPMDVNAPISGAGAAHQHTKRFSSALIQSNRRPNMCIGTEFIRGPRPGIGVTLVECSTGTVVLWDIERGAGSVRVAGGTTMVLEAVSPVGNFGRLATENYVEGKGSQNWYYTDDNRIAITGGNQCLDDDGTRLQTYQCTTGNTNQIFTICNTDTNPPQPPPTGNDPYPDIPRGTVYPDRSGNERRIHPKDRGDLCLSVLGGQFRAGADVAIAYCMPDSDPQAQFQIWDTQPAIGRVVNQIPLAQNRNYCLSADFANGSGARIQPCSGGARRWQWDNQAGRFLLEGYTYCLDVRRESRPGNESPLQSRRQAQVWECGVGNPQQQWTLLW